MRAVYFPELSYELGDTITLRDHVFHHFVNVIRLKVGNEVLLLDGKGTKMIGEVTEIQKKLLEVLIKKKEIASKKNSFDLIVGFCKKEYLEPILRMSVEIGINRVFLLKTEFSQAKDFREDRIQKILISALEQSNNIYLPTIETIQSFDELASVSKIYDCVLWFNSETKSDLSTNNSKVQASKKVAIVIGPEGGFSLREKQLMQTWEHFIETHLSVPIMKAVTAVPVAAGYLLGLKQNNY